MGNVTNLWRHPVKGVGGEELQSVALAAGKTMPLDRHWAIAHEDSKFNFDAPEWARCMNFARGARGHSLMAVTSQFDEISGKHRFSHPDLDDLLADPDNATDAAALVEWVRKISNPNRSLPKQVVSVAGRGMTDSGTASLSILSNASLAALSEKCGEELHQRRFRANVWVDRFDAWEEFNWLGKTIRIGDAEFEITKPVERCLATTVNPATGISDVDTLGTLKSNWGHINFGVFGVVTKSGTICANSKIEIL
ncbi:GTP-binding protein [Amylibacter ulvae]|uniref:GTP-binding protein n=1 Tax=Paramylibacter ulvae TaxID=1651968 RepID=A0ABQ3D0F5_9RHOB|nr:MOSC domain-containing protein [Amylibacter ulvae]GHA50097.1 GTP-binding protein [Amylibacter ulvae]